MPNQLCYCKKVARRIYKENSKKIWLYMKIISLLDKIVYFILHKMWYNILITSIENYTERGASKMHDALDVARYIINRETAQGRTVSNLRLQKLLYFIQCAFFGVFGKPCFGDEMEAWDYGPVVPKVYRKYKIYGSVMIPPSDEQDLFRETETNLINKMLDACAEKRTSDLVEITHAQSPWKDAYVPGMNNLICKDAIRKYMQR